MQGFVLHQWFCCRARFETTAFLSHRQVERLLCARPFCRDGRQPPTSRTSQISGDTDRHTALVIREKESTELTQPFNTNKTPWLSEEYPLVLSFPCELPKLLSFLYHYLLSSTALSQPHTWFCAPDHGLAVTFIAIWMFLHSCLTLPSHQQTEGCCTTLLPTLSTTGGESPTCP